MDQVKIGMFISECRKKENLTQSKLAEMLGITDRAVSKWENGRSLPDSGLMLDLCKILKISVNDLLSGEVVMMDEQNKMNEQFLIEMVKQKETNDKRMLELEIAIGVLSAIILLGFTFIAAYIPMKDWIRALLIVLGFVFGIIGFCIALRIEQVAGYYKCKKCGHKHVPTYSAVFLAMHYGRSRYMKCPKCGKYSYQKKVIEN